MLKSPIQPAKFVEADNVRMRKSANIGEAGRKGQRGRKIEKKTT